MRLPIAAVVLFSCCMQQGMLLAQAPPVATSPSAVDKRSGVLTASEVAKIMPATVFFRGLSAPVQARNSGGVRLQDQKLVLVALVDTSGYSSQVQEKYQAYLITESALSIGSHHLPPGAYGCGFIAGDTFIVQDLGAHDLFTTASVRDPGLRRPTPLQLVADPAAARQYRLYAGRSYVSFQVAGGQ